MSTGLTKSMDTLWNPTGNFTNPSVGDYDWNIIGDQPKP